MEPLAHVELRNLTSYRRHAGMQGDVMIYRQQLAAVISNSSVPDHHQDECCQHHEKGSAVSHDLNLRGGQHAQRVKTRKHLPYIAVVVVRLQGKRSQVSWAYETTDAIRYRRPAIRKPLDILLEHLR